MKNDNEVMNAYPLSPQQARIWRGEREGGVYRSGCVLKVAGALDVQRLRARLGRLVEEHELLRTAFVRPAGLQQPAQVVDGCAAPVCVVEEWRAADEVQCAREARARCTQLMAAAVDYERGPLLQVHVLSTSSDAFVVLCVPALLMDGPGLLRLASELFGATPSAEVPQYVDVAGEFNDALLGSLAAEGERWWTAEQEELAGWASVPGEQRAVLGVGRAQLSERCDAQLSAALDGAGEQAVSWLLSAWTVLLSRVLRVSQLAVAVGCDARVDEELAQVMGPLRRHVPLRAKVQPQQSFEALRTQVQRQLQKCQEWQDYYGGLPKDAGPGTDYLPYGFEVTRVPRGVPEVLHYGALEERSHVRLAVLEQHGQWTLQLCYERERFDEGRMRRLLGQYRQLLGSALRAPGSAVQALAHVDDEERAQLLAGQAAADEPARSVVQLFAEAARACPQRLALSGRDGAWTYQQLDEISNRLARHLRSLGVRAESRVAVCLDRRPNWIVALLGLLKAGGIYVPIDPEFHPQRVRDVLEDAACAVWISDREHAGVLGQPQGDLVLLDELPGAFSGCSGDALDERIDAQQLAYLIYTSGSTGRPKGVGVTHGAIHIYIREVLARLQLSEDAQLLSLATIGADLGHTALFGALCSGRTLRLVRAAAGLEAEELARQLQEQPVDCLKIVPTHLRALLSVQEAQRLLPRQCLVLGGAAAHPELIQKIRALSPDCRIVNHYGPTETTVGVTTHAVQLEEECVPLGRALPGTRAYVLDEAAGLAGEAIAGELCIGGASLARGYWGRPELTAERFVPDPYCAAPGMRMYRTGDLVDVRGGCLYFHGRIDHQVKIRGYRVELGEIEAVLCRHAEVAAAAVVLLEGERLGAYIGCSQKLSTETLREWLRTQLPEYMVPQAWQLMRQLPLSRNGKVDRQALPALSAQHASTQAYAAPRTALERQLAELWQQVLGLPRVGIHDNFFEIGGDSIVAIQMAARLNKLGYGIAPKQIFEQQNIAALASRLPPPAVQRQDHAPAVGRFGLTPIQQRHFELHPDGLAHFNQAVQLRPAAQLDWDVFTRVLAHLQSHHDGLRSRFVRDEQRRWWQEIPAQVSVSMPTLVDLRAIPAQIRPAIQREVFAAVQKSLRLDGRLMRLVGVQEDAAQPPRLLWCIHHLLVDGVSWRILLEDLNCAAYQLSSGQAIELPQKSISPKQWAEALAHHANSEDVKAQLGSWSRHRASRPGRAAPGVVLERDFQTESIELDAGHTQLLLRETLRQYHCEIRDVLIAALSMALESWQLTNVDIELEGHGRETLAVDWNTARTVGWFTSRFPLRLRAQGSTPVARLQAVKECLRALPARGIGYGLLRYLAGEEQTREAVRDGAFPRISFNYLGQLGQSNTTNTLFAVIPDALEELRSPLAVREQPLALSGAIAGERLNLQLAFAANLFSREAARGLLEEYRAALLLLIDAGAQLARIPHTPSDFPEAGLDQPGLDALLADRQSIEAIYPLSPLQHGMLFETLIRDGIGVNTLQLDIGIKGDLDRDALRSAWHDVVQRHPILRTIFSHVIGERPLQLVSRAPEMEWQEHDWSALDAPAQTARMAKFLEEDRRRPFDLEHAVAMRLTLIRLGAARHRMIWTRHHSLLDGWSSAIVMRELIESYAHRRQGVAAVLPPAQTYRRYIQWLGQRQGGTGVEPWWRSYLDGFEGATPIVEDDYWYRRMSEVKSEEHIHAFGPEFSRELHAYAKACHVTVGVLFNAAWGLLLASLSGKDDVVFGTVVSGRPPEVEDVETIVGPLINTVPLRLKLRADHVGEWLTQLQKELLAREQFAHLPLTRIQQLAGRGGSPLFASLLVVQNYVTSAQRRAMDLDRGRVEFDIESSQTTYKISYPLTAFVTLDDDYSVRFCYDTQSFGRARVQQFGALLEKFLRGLTQDRAADLFAGALAGHIATCPDGETSSNAPLPTVVAVGSFALEPLQAPLTQVLELAGAPMKVALAPYSQIMQQLLDDASALRRNSRGFNLVVLRWDDWLGKGGDERGEAFERNMRELREALEHAARSTPIPCIVLVAPASAKMRASEEAVRICDFQLGQLRELAARIANLHVVCGCSALEEFVLREYADEHAERVAHIPYTAQAFAAMAVGIVRQWHAVARRAPKVVVVDCDDTLWQGTVAELGTQGIAFQAAHHRLHEQLIRLHAAGVLICLCSRNVEEDVLDVFVRREDMQLGLDHVLAWRINWQAKSVNLQELARELQLGLDSFVFLDDDPVQCAEVRAACPGVTVVQMPRDEQELDVFLRHGWVLDTPPASTQAQRRTAQYRTNVVRASEQKRAPSFKQFIDSMQLNIIAARLTATDFERAAELTTRTNQFNLSGTRYSHAQLESRIRGGELDGITFRLSDRFGDYGLVGVLLFVIYERTLRVENFALSCRALGRGLEHRMLNELGAIAAHAGCEHVNLPYVRLDRNQPMMDFLALNLPACGTQNDAGVDYLVEPSFLCALEWRIPEQAPEQIAPADGEAASEPPPPAIDYLALAAAVADLEQLTERIRVGSQAPARSTRAYEAPDDEYEEAVARIWTELLGIPRIGRNDHFFELGGHSLIATRVVARCRQRYDVEVPLVAIFDHPCLRDFAARVRGLAAQTSHERRAEDGVEMVEGVL